MFGAAIVAAMSTDTRESGTLFSSVDFSFAKLKCFSPLPTSKRLLSCDQKFDVVRASEEAENIVGFEVDRIASFLHQPMFLDLWSRIVRFTELNTDRVGAKEVIPQRTQLDENAFLSLGAVYARSLRFLDEVGEENFDLRKLADAFQDGGASRSGDCPVNLLYDLEAMIRREIVDADRVPERWTLSVLWCLLCWKSMGPTYVMPVVCRLAVWAVTVLSCAKCTGTGSLGGSAAVTVASGLRNRAVQQAAWSEVLLTVDRACSAGFGPYVWRPFNCSSHPSREDCLKNCWRANGVPLADGYGFDWATPRKMFSVTSVQEAWINLRGTFVEDGNGEFWEFEEDV